MFNGEGLMSSKTLNGKTFQLREQKMREQLDILRANSAKKWMKPDLSRNNLLSPFENLEIPSEKPRRGRLSAINIQIPKGDIESEGIVQKAESERSFSPIFEK